MFEVRLFTVVGWLIQLSKLIRLRSYPVEFVISKELDTLLLKK